MTSPYYSDAYLTLLHGDAAETLATLPAESVQTRVRNDGPRSRHHDKHVHSATFAGGKPHTGHRDGHPLGSNPGDVWTISTVPYSGTHEAVMPPDLVRRCILAGCPEGATVLDPFIGSGTVGMIANRHGRAAIGIDLSEACLAEAMKRCHDAPLPFGEAS